MQLTSPSRTVSWMTNAPFGESTARSPPPPTCFTLFITRSHSDGGCRHAGRSIHPVTGSDLGFSVLLRDTLSCDRGGRGGFQPSTHRATAHSDRFKHLDLSSPQWRFKKMALPALSLGRRDAISGAFQSRKTFPHVLNVWGVFLTWKAPHQAFQTYLYLFTLYYMNDGVALVSWSEKPMGCE